MTFPRVDYIRRQLLNHIRLFFTEEALRLFHRTEVLFVDSSTTRRTRRSAIVIPTDVPAPDSPRDPYKVGFNGTQLTLWNRLPRPDEDGWESLPDDSSPLWYRHRSGTVMPAWNLFGNLFELMTFGEERRSRERDKHRRFVGSMSPRCELDLLEVPAVNEAAAALVAACAGMNRGEPPAMHLNDLCRPVVAVLSHDCDILRGDDRWTQMVRAFRIMQPVKRGRLPALRNLWWILRNAIAPRRFYFDNVTGMIDIERTFGFTSIFYLINGSGGRFGARSGPEILEEFVSVCPETWDVGMHYNYDTLLNHDRFRSQRDQLSKIVHQPIKAGRAHYLRFDPDSSLEFLNSFDLLCDESAGYADRIGYRCGVGGCFQAYDVASERALGIFEVPLIVMDATLANQYSDDPVAAFRRLVRHLNQIGGAVSIVFHPGQFHNPEFPKMFGLYHQMLIVLREFGATSRTALSLARQLSEAEDVVS